MKETENELNRSISFKSSSVPQFQLKRSFVTRFLVIIGYLTIAVSFIIIGQNNSLNTLLKIPYTYSDLTFSLIFTLLIAYYTHRHNKKLFKQHLFLSDWKKISVKQILFGILIPSCTVMMLELVYLHSLNIDRSVSSIFNLEFPLSLLYLTLINLFYDVLYLFQLKQQHLLDKMHPVENALNFICVQFGAAEKQILIEDCAYLFTNEKTIWLQTHTNSKYLLPGSLDQWEAKLKGNNFYRINRQFLASVNAIKSIEQTKTRRLKVNFVLSPKREVYVSRPNIAQFRKWWNHNYLSSD